MTSPDVLGDGAATGESGGKGSWFGRANRSADAGDAPALPTGRGIELVLLALAAVIVTSALVLVEANQPSKTPRWSATARTSSSWLAEAR